MAPRVKKRQAKAATSETIVSEERPTADPPTGNFFDEVPGVSAVDKGVSAVDKGVSAGVSAVVSWPKSESVR